MMNVQIVKTPDLEGKRRTLVLAEDRVGHYDEFRRFFVRQFSLEQKRLSEPGYVRAPSGAVFALVFIGRSGEPFPDGLEVYAIVDAIEPLDDDAVDADLWELLTWIIQGVGGEWTVDDLMATGRLFRLPFVSKAGA